MKSPQVQPLDLSEQKRAPSIVTEAASRNQR
jgi:hypothetical protein